MDSQNGKNSSGTVETRRFHYPNMQCSYVLCMMLEYTKAMIYYKESHLMISGIHQLKVYIKF